MKGQEEDAPFNMAMMFYISLNKLLEQKQEARLNNDLNEYYKLLKIIYHKIIFKVSTTKQTKIDELFKLAKNNMQFDINNQIVFQNVSNTLDKIAIQITEIMDSKKMIFPSIDMNKMDAVMKRYGIDEKE